MAPLSNYIESALGYVFYSFKGRDSGLFSHSNAFAAHRTPTIKVRSPSCPSDVLGIDNTPFGRNVCPDLEWETPTALSKPIREWILVAEDPDVPIPWPIVHGMYHGIPASKTSVTAADLKLKEGSQVELEGGFSLGANLRGTVFAGARPIMGHGPHRYVFTVVGLTEPLGIESGKGSGKKGRVTKEEMLKLIDGKIAAWGEWVSTYERKFE